MKTVEVLGAKTRAELVKKNRGCAQWRVGRFLHSADTALNPAK